MITTTLRVFCCHAEMTEALARPGFLYLFLCFKSSRAEEHQCCFLGLAGRFLLQILELENDKNKTKSHVSMNTDEGLLRLRKLHSLKFSFQQSTGEGSLFIFG